MSPRLPVYVGVATVRQRSARQIWTPRRWQAPTFLRQTFLEWPGQTMGYSAWAKVYYERMSQEGKKHAVILRALAFKWIRILWKCRHDHSPCDEARYLRQLAHHKSPNALAS